MLRLILKPFDASCYCAKLFSNIKVKEFWNWNWHWRLSCFSQSKELSFFPIIREMFCPHQPFGFPPTFSQTSLPTCSKVWVFFSYHVLGFRSQTHSCSFLVCNLLTHETVPYHWLGLIYRLARSKTETGKVKVVWAFPELLLVNYFDNIPKQKSQRSDGYHSTTSSHPHLKVTWARVNPDQSDVTTTAQKLVRDDVTDQRRVWGKRCQSSTQFVWMQQIRDRKLLHHWQILSHTGMGHINYAVWPTLCHFCGLAHIQMRPKTVSVWIVVWLQPWRSEEGDLWWFSTSFKRVIFRNVC